MSVEVRRIRSDEWAELRDLRLAALADEPDAFTSSHAEEAGRPAATWRAWAAAGAEGGPSYLAVAVEPGAGGFAGLAAGAPREGVDDANWLFSMWVAPHARHGGVGRRLVAAVVDWSRSTERRRLLLRVSEANAAALALYRACGFVPLDERVPLRPGSAISTVVMELPS